LIDGLAVMDALNLVAITPSSQLVPEIRLSDLVFAIMLLQWVVRLAQHRATLRMPRISFLLLALIIWSSLSSVFAMHPYLGFVEVSNQLRYFVVFLYAVNNIQGDRALVLVGCLLLAMLTVQSSMTGARYVLGFGPIPGGRAGTVDTTEHLNVARDGGGKRAYGTVLSPRGTAAHLLLLLPWPVLTFLFCRRRWLRIVLAGVFMIGTVALIMTYSRSALLGYLVGGAIGLALALRWGILSRKVGVLVVLGSLVFAVVAAPVTKSYFDKRPDNINVRLAQYKTAGIIFLDNLVLGVGPNNSAATQRRYATGVSSGTAVADATKKADIHPIHSQHLANLVELGIVGFALYMGFFACVLLAAARLTRSDRELERILGGGYLISTSALFVQSASDPIFEHSVFVLLWFLSGIVVLARESAVAAAQATTPHQALRAPTRPWWMSRARTLSVDNDRAQ
jgi:O-antigen ligase